jgi:hypothetical protein
VSFQRVFFRRQQDQVEDVCPRKPGGVVNVDCCVDFDLAIPESDSPQLLPPRIMVDQKNFSLVTLRRAHNGATPQQVLTTPKD